MEREDRREGGDGRRDEYRVKIMEESLWAPRRISCILEGLQTNNKYFRSVWYTRSGWWFCTWGQTGKT